MDIETIGILFAIGFGFVGLIGGIPQILKWAEPKPHVKIVKLNILFVNHEKKRVGVTYEIENKSSFLTRDADATNIKLEITEIDKNHVQWDETPIMRDLTQCLIAGGKFVKDYDDIGFGFSGFSGNTASYPFTIYFKVFCDEGIMDKKKIQIEAKKGA